MKYTIQEGNESLERVKLMMKYSLDKTLNENLITLVEQKDTITPEEKQILTDIYKSVYVGPGTNEELLLSALSKITTPELFNKLNANLASQTQVTNPYKTFEELFNGELGYGDKETANKIKNILSKIGVDVSFRIVGEDNDSVDNFVVKISSTNTPVKQDDEQKTQKRGFKTISEFKKVFPCVFPSTVAEETVFIDGKGTSYIKVKGESGTVYRMYSSGNLYWDSPFERVYKKIVCNNGKLTLSEGITSISEQIPDTNFKRNEKVKGTKTQQTQTTVKAPTNLTPEQTTEVQQALLSLGYNLGDSGPKFNGVTGSWNKETQAAFNKFKQENYGSGRDNIGALIGDGYYSLKNQEVRKSNKDMSAGEQGKATNTSTEKDKEVKTSEQKKTEAADLFNKTAPKTFIDFKNPIEVEEAFGSVSALMKRYWRSSYFGYFYQSLKSFIILNPNAEYIDEYKGYLNSLKNISETAASKAGKFDFKSFINPTAESVKENYEEVNLSDYSPWNTSGTRIIAYRLVSEFNPKDTIEYLTGFVGGEGTSVSASDCQKIGDAYLKLARIPENKPTAPTEKELEATKVVISQNIQKQQLQEIKAIIAACKRGNQYSGDMLTRIEKLDDVDLGPRLQINFQVTDPNKQPY